MKTQPTVERNPQALLPKMPPGLEAQVEGAFRKLCEALSTPPLSCYASRDSIFLYSVTYGRGTLGGMPHA